MGGLAGWGVVEAIRVRSEDQDQYNWDGDVCLQWGQVVSATGFHFIQPYPKRLMIDCGRRERREEGSCTGGIPQGGSKGRAWSGFGGYRSGSLGGLTIFSHDAES